MGSPHFSSEHAPFEVDLKLGSRLRNYKLTPKYHDVDLLRAYLVIDDLDSRKNDKSGAFTGFLVCLSFWAMVENGWPFSMLLDAYNYFEWSNNTIIICNLFLLASFWTIYYVYVTGIEDKRNPPWNVSDEELGNLIKRIRRIKRSQ